MEADGTPNDAQKVHLSIHLSTSSPHTISLSDSNPANPLQLLATIRQVQSTNPTRAITLLTRYTALDTIIGDDSFFWRRLNSPTSTAADGRVIHMYPQGRHLTQVRISGPLDLRQREHFNFITVPPVGQGEAQWSFDLSPSRLFRHESRSIEENLAKFSPGEKFTITPNNLRVSWWTLGGLDRELKDKKFSRWQMPSDAGDTADVSSRLRDPIDLHDVNHLSSRSAVEDEEKPNVQEMKSEGWVFSEPAEQLEVKWENAQEGAVFEFVE